ncbi:hypothetical protein GGS21DRAFT_493609 [Xylaria nigripes]|nr:hypothetical protein GGS21DRAFT_493609 [Xylaria nigripes]
MTFFGGLRQHLRDSPSSALGTKPSKQETLKAFRLARIDVLNARNIKNAWKTAGIHPRDRTKLLSSKYVILKEKGVARDAAPTSSTHERECTPEVYTESVETPIKTPSTGQELRNSTRKLAAANPSLNIPCSRLLSRKASKALDLQAYKIAQLESTIEYLRAKVAKQTKAPRQSGKPPPGSRFVRMGHVRRAHRRLRNRTVYEDELEECDVPIVDDPAYQTESEDCIVVNNTRD